MTVLALSSAGYGRLYRAALATGGVFALSGSLQSSWVSRLPEVRDRLGASTGALGIALLGGAIGSIASTPLTGRLVRRYGSRRVVMAMSTLSYLALIGLGLVHSVIQLGLTLLVFGIGYGSWDVAMNVHGHGVEYTARRAWMPRYHAAWSVGSFAAAGLGSLAAGVGLPVEVHFIIAAGLGVVGVAVLLMWFLGDSDTAAGDPADGDTAAGDPADRNAATGHPADGNAATGRPADGSTTASDPPDHDTAVGHADDDTAAGDLAEGDTAAGDPAEGDAAVAALSASRRKAGRRISRRIVLLGAVMACATLIEGAASDWLGIYFDDVRHTAAAGGAAAYTTFAVAMAVSRAAGTQTIGWLGRGRAVRASGVLALIGVALLLESPDVIGAYVGAALWGLGTALVFPAVISAAGETGEHSADSISMVAPVGYSGFLFGPPLIGLLADSMGLQNSLWVVGALAAVMVALAGVTREVDRRAGAPALG